MYFYFLHEYVRTVNIKLIRTYQYPTVSINKMVRCGYCNVNGHTKTSCSKRDLHILLRLCSGGRDLTELGTLTVGKIPINKISEVMLLKRGLIPYIIHDGLYVVRYNEEDDQFRVECHVDSPTAYVRWKREHLNRISSSENKRILREESRRIRARVAHFKRNTYVREHNPEFHNFEILNEIVNGDHIAVTRRVIEQHRIRQVNYNRRAMERRRDRVAEEALERNEDPAVAVQRLQQGENVGRFIGPRPNPPRPVQPPTSSQLLRATMGTMMDTVSRMDYPNIRETAFDTLECPICLDDLGEISKMILRCGHQACVKCIMLETLRSCGEMGVSECKCPICREPYLKIR